MSIDKSKINLGDKVKASIRFSNDENVWVTADWVEVKPREGNAPFRDDWKVGGLPLGASYLTITDHEPNLAALKDRVAKAEAVLAEARKALDDAQKSVPSVIGRKVKYINSFDDENNIGFIVNESTSLYHVKFAGQGTYQYLKNEIEFID